MNLNDSMDFDLRRIFLLWGRELAFLIPEKLKKALNDKSGYLYIRVADGKFKIIGTINNQTKTIAELNFDEQGLNQFKQLVENNEALKRAQLVLSLSSDQAIQKVVQLPSAAKGNVEQVVAFEMDKYTPFSHKDVYFALKEQGKEKNEHIEVKIVLTPKEILDAIFLKLNYSQVYPDIVEYENAANDFIEDYQIYNLIPEWERPAKNKVAQAITGFLSIVLTLLILAVFIYPVWYESETVDALKQELKELKKDTDIVQEHQFELAEIIEETEELNKIKQSAPAVLALITSLSDLIKDDTWLTHLQLKNGKLQIQGQSPAAEEMISILEGSPFFNNVRFVSPLTQDKRTGLERFQISANVASIGVDL